MSQVLEVPRSPQLEYQHDNSLPERRNPKSLIESTIRRLKKLGQTPIDKKSLSFNPESIPEINHDLIAHLNLATIKPEQLVGILNRGALQTETSPECYRNLEEVLGQHTQRRESNNKTKQEMSITPVRFGGDELIVSFEYFKDGNIVNRLYMMDIAGFGDINQVSPELADYIIARALATANQEAISLQSKFNFQLQDTNQNDPEEFVSEAISKITDELCKIPVLYKRGEQIVSGSFELKELGGSKALDVSRPSLRDDGKLLQQTIEFNKERFKSLENSDSNQFEQGRILIASLLTDPKIYDAVYDVVVINFGLYCEDMQQLEGYILRFVQLFLESQSDNKTPVDFKNFLMDSISNYKNQIRRAGDITPESASQLLMKFAQIFPTQTVNTISRLARFIDSKQQRYIQETLRLVMTECNLEKNNIPALLDSVDILIGSLETKSEDTKNPTRNLLHTLTQLSERLISLNQNNIVPFFRSLAPGISTAGIGTSKFTSQLRFQINNFFGNEVIPEGIVGQLLAKIFEYALPEGINGRLELEVVNLIKFLNVPDENRRHLLGLLKLAVILMNKGLPITSLSELKTYLQIEDSVAESPGPLGKETRDVLNSLNWEVNHPLFPQFTVIPYDYFRQQVESGVYLQVMVASTKLKAINDLVGFSSGDGLMAQIGVFLQEKLKVGLIQNNIPKERIEIILKSLIISNKGGEIFVGMKAKPTNDGGPDLSLSEYLKAERSGLNSYEQILITDILNDLLGKNHQLSFTRLEIGPDGNPVYKTLNAPVACEKTSAGADKGYYRNSLAMLNEISQDSVFWTELIQQFKNTFTDIQRIGNELLPKKLQKKFAIEFDSKMRKIFANSNEEVRTKLESVLNIIGYFTSSRGYRVTNELFKVIDQNSVHLTEQCRGFLHLLKGSQEYFNNLISTNSKQAEI